MCVCVCVYMYTHTHIYTHIYIYIYVYMCIDVCMCIHIYIYIYIHTYIYISIYIYIYMYYTHVYVDIHIHIINTISCIILCIVIVIIHIYAQCPRQSVEQTCRTVESSIRRVTRFNHKKFEIIVVQNITKRIAPPFSVQALCLKSLWSVPSVWLLLAGMWVKLELEHNTGLLDYSLP